MQVLVLLVLMLVPLMLMPVLVLLVLVPVPLGLLPVPVPLMLMPVPLMPVLMDPISTHESTHSFGQLWVFCVHPMALVWQQPY
jgi:hypothetical protein